MNETPSTSTAATESGESQAHRAVAEAVTAIRPVIQMDGGDITLVSFDEDSGIVVVELSGACVGCPASSMTLKAGVERILKDRVPEVTEVQAVGIDAEFASETEPEDRNSPFASS